MDTLFIAEHFITPFKFLYNGQVVVGMNFRNEFFGQVVVASVQKREWFFQQFDRFNPHSSDMVITASNHRYIAWVSLRSSLAPYLLVQAELSEFEVPDVDSAGALALQVA